MRKRINITSSIIIGAAALWVGLAVHAQAISISIRANLDTGMHSWIWKTDQATDEAARSFDQSDGIQMAASSLLAKPAAEPLELASNNSRSNKQNESKKSPPSPGQNPNPSAVPDGGMTLMMLGGAFCGLACWARKLKTT